MKKKNYEAPLMEVLRVELEKGFMTASIYEGGERNADGVTIEEHGFAKPGQAWEGDYSGFGTDKTGWD